VTAWSAGKVLLALSGKLLAISVSPDELASIAATL
jgi:hypothetical protein